MDIRQFMNEFISQKTDENPTEAFDNPQVELFRQLSKRAEIDDQVERIASQDLEEVSDRQSEVEGQRGTAEVPGIFVEAETGSGPEAEASTPPEEVESPAEAAVPQENEGQTVSPTSPAGEIGAPAEVAVELTEHAPPAEFREPVSESTPAAQPDTPTQESIAPTEWVPPEVFHGPDIQLHDGDMTHVPKDLPFDFDEMLGLAQAQASGPSFGEIRTMGGDQILMPKLPQLPPFPEIHTQPSTDFAAAKLGELSTMAKQWERNR